MDTALVILNVRTLVPIRFVVENLGYSVAWKSAEKNRYSINFLFQIIIIYREMISRETSYEKSS